ncbi:TPA: transcription elongation factor GreA [Candidatus Bipolaricaulota bacterium]|nr:transcription elongation factor GreA [Candidatus Bipolaricaulota bacterium]
MEREERFLTREGYEQLRAELEYLEKVRRPEVISRIKRARELGDLSENAEYIAAKEEQALIEGRIAEIERQLRAARIIEPERAPSERVRLGSRVRLLELRSGREVEYTLVTPAEAAPAEGKVSLASPLGQALLERRVGEEVEVKAPAGPLSYRILEIS